MAGLDGRRWPDTTGRRVLVVCASIVAGLVAFAVLRSAIDSELGTAVALVVGFLVANVGSYVLQKRLFDR